jgi:hypothetical protein
MKRMFTAALTAAALGATPATQALGVTPKQAAKIAKRVFDREIQQWEASRVMPAQITTPVEPRCHRGPRHDSSPCDDGRPFDQREPCGECRPCDHRRPCDHGGSCGECGLRSYRRERH